MAEKDTLREVVKGQPISASQHNIIVRAIRSVTRDNRQRNYELPQPDRIRLTTGWTACQVMELGTIASKARRALAFASNTFSAPNSDNFEIVICDPAEGWANFGYRPVMALIDGTFPSIGAMVGPAHGETSLLTNYPGFRFLGASDLTGIGWVMRDRGIATGQGTMVSAGSSGTPATFYLENVSFSSGFNGWDGTTDLEVVNTFDDEAAAGLIVQFKWDAHTGAYVSTDVECP